MSLLFDDHGAALNDLGRRIHHDENKKWWVNLETGQPIQRNVGEMICLVHSELSEAMEGHRKNLMDTHLLGRPQIEVELADAVIRILDMGVGLNLDIGGAVEEKIAYNRIRKDHSREARMAEGGKRY